jgi:hypothetical protein
MTTTRRANYLFKVSEFSPELREGNVEGTLRIDPVPFISTEYRGVGGDEDVLDGDLLGFDLKDGTSMADAKRIATFLNQNLESIAVTRFGDAEDIAVEVDNSEHTQQIVKDGLTEALTAMKNSLAAGDVQGAIKSVEALEGWAGRLFDDWTHTINRFGR